MNLFLFLLLTSIGILMIEGTDIREKFDNFELIFHPTLKTWYDARDYCKSFDDTDLVDLEDRALGETLNQFLINIDAKDTDSFWLGAKESNEGNEFIWEASGTKFPYDISDIKQDTSSYKSFCLTIDDFSDKPELCDNKAYPVCIKMNKCFKKKSFVEFDDRYYFDPNKIMTFNEAKGNYKEPKVCNNLLSISSLKQLERLKPFLDEIFECNNNTSIWIDIDKYHIKEYFDKYYFTIFLWAKGSPKSEYAMKYIRLIKSDGKYKLEDVDEYAVSNVICSPYEPFHLKKMINLECYEPTTYNFDGYEYHYVNQKKSYESAKWYCMNMNMKLLEVHSTEEYYWVLSLVIQYAKFCYDESTTYWLGAKFINNEFRWNSDNSTVKYLGKSLNEYGHYEACLRMDSYYSKFEWRSDLCRDYKRFICYRNINLKFSITTEVNFETEIIDLSINNHMNSKADNNELNNLLGNVHLNSSLLLENYGASYPETNVKNSINFITNFPNGTQVNATYINA